MVWHAHMLNPRSFFEDCMRRGLRQLWTSGMPWPLINSSISIDFVYKVSDDCKAAWVGRTGHSWNSIDDPLFKSLNCPACKTLVSIPWTTCGVDENYSGEQLPGILGNGYGDGSLLFTCPACAVFIDKELLSVSRFCKDTEALLARQRPMPGTILEPSSGMPETVPGWHLGANRMFPRTFPNRMLQHVLRIQIIDLIKPGIAPHPTMATVRDMIEQVLASNAAIRTIDGLTGVNMAVRRYRLDPAARLSVRKMMRCYWENFSPFALDLCGAVIRQGSFIEKMITIDWLHSPSASNTMARLLAKYHRFFGIMAAHPTKVAVPTLDVDLAWHTHQLSPSSYYVYSIMRTSKLIDHDDKIEESALSTSFEWTSKVYQETYGEVYSECTCWYCEGKQPLIETIS